MKPSDRLSEDAIASFQEVVWQQLKWLSEQGHEDNLKLRESASDRIVEAFFQAVDTLDKPE